MPLRNYGNCCSLRNHSKVIGIVGVFLTILGGILLIYWSRIFNSFLDSELALGPHSRSYSLWKVIPIPIYMEFYLFNWTNPGLLKNRSQKPILEQLGPYVFREHRVKVIEAWVPENNTVTYRQNRTWTFEPLLSNGSLDDLITTLNVPAVTAAYTLRDMSFVKKLALDVVFEATSTKYFVTKRAREFLFEGYKDPLIDLSHLVPSSAPFDKFGWMYARNGSVDYDGVYNMKTDSKHLGLLMDWNYANSTPFYESPCSSVGGSAGELFPVRLEGTTAGIFSSDICRTLDLEYKEVVTISNIQGKRFLGSDLMFANSSTKPENWCFCGDNGQTCYPNGILNVSSCKWGAPAFISFPHFYLADPVYRSSIIGMNPQENLHQFFIDIEPETGIPLDVSAAFQINILLQPDHHYRIFNKVPRIFFPMLWFRQVAHIDDTIGYQVRFLIALPDVGLILGYVFISIGVSLFVIIGIIHCSLNLRKDEDAHYLVSQRRPRES